MTEIRKADAKLINRAAIINITALALGLGIAVAQQSPEFAKLMPASQTRDILFFIAPLATLASLQYTLAGKTYSYKNLATESLILSGAYMWFLAVVLRGYVGSIKVRENCGWMRDRLFGCDQTWAPNNFLTIGLIFIGLVMSFAAIWTHIRKNARIN